MSEAEQPSSQGKGRPAGDEQNRWQARPVLAALLRAVIVAIPVVCSLGVAWLISSLLPAGSGTGRWGYRALIVVCAVVVAMVAERCARRLLPMTTLLKLSMLFPNKAPSRLKVARRVTSTSRLQELGRQRGGSAADAATTVMELLAALARHDKRTRGHAERVRVFTDLVAEQLRLTRAEQDRLRWAALLHDIGKLIIDPALLNKPGKPSDREWRILRAHPEAGARTAAGLLEWLGDWASAIVEHHERFDGTGYPEGLQGAGISRAGRIVAVVDAFEVMTAARSYKRPMSTLKAREELARCAGTHFDPVMVRAFLAISLPRLLWATGPLSALVQLPFIGALRDTGTRLATAGGPAVAAAAGAVVVATTGVAATATDQPARPPVSAADAHVPQVRLPAPAPKSSPRMAVAAALSAEPTPLIEPIAVVINKPPVRSSVPTWLAPAVVPASQPPEVMVTSGPVSATTSTDATIAFTVDDPTARVTCSLDGEPALACTSPWSATDLAMGTHTLTIEATNTAGSATTAFTWTVVPAPAPPPVGSAPTVGFTSGPVASSTATDATVAFQLTGAPDGVTCSLDGSPAVDCMDSWSASGLASGPHALTVTAVNAFGVGTATYTWTVEPPAVAAPVISVTAGPVAASTATDATVTFDVSDPDAVVTCSLDAALSTSCGGTWSAGALTVGAHTLTISATNSGGTASIAHSWTVIAAPVPLPGAPVIVIGGGPVASTAATDATVTFTVDDPSAAVSCSLDGAPPISCGDVWSASGLAVGPHTLTISATNGGGTGDAAYSWTVEPAPVTAPVVTVTSGPVASSSASNAVIQFEVSDPTATVSCSLDGGPSLSCASPWSAANLAVGTHTLTITATNAGGAGDATYTWTVVPPKPANVTLTSTPPASTPTKSATFAWYQEPGLTYHCSLDGAAFTACAGSITYSKLAPRGHTFRIHSTNASGAVSSATVFTWQVK